MKHNSTIKTGMLTAGLFMISTISFGQKITDNIRLNQIGFYPNAEKIAIVDEDAVGKFMIASTDLSQTYFTGELSGVIKSKFSPKKVKKADFSDFDREGIYVLYIPGYGYSYQFEIRPNIHSSVADGALKSYYYQRASTALPYEYAGIWSRPAGHPDDHVMIHSSALSEERPEGTVVSSSKGWYDAGDYGKYVVNSGISTATLLSLYEDFPDYFVNRDVYIPESGNNVPDLLDEALWNLRWMLTMQDPNDGGVYHKMTTASFEGMVMPAEATSQRYMIQKSVTATLDFAAVMAQASRVFAEYKSQFPGLSDSCINMAKKAWEWAQKHPEQLYNQNAINQQYDPDVSTGAYGDRDATDEFIWAASELFVTTGDKKYLKAVELFPDENMPIPSWGDVRLLGYYTLLRNSEMLKDKYGDELETLKSRLVTMADELIEGVKDEAYATVMGRSEKDFVWGSNAVAANQGIALVQAYLVSKDNNYLNYALTNLDYLLGRNATGYSFLTGFGDKTPMHIHHRPSEADEILEPYPGLLAGGPNPGQQDKCNYPSDYPDESYTDEACSYASNEIAINWNAPFVYLAYAIEILEEELGQ